MEFVNIEVNFPIKGVSLSGDIDSASAEKIIDIILRAKTPKTESEAA